MTTAPTDTREVLRFCDPLSLAVLAAHEAFADALVSDCNGDAGPFSVVESGGWRIIRPALSVQAWTDGQHDPTCGLTVEVEPGTLEPNRWLDGSEAPRWPL